MSLDLLVYLEEIELMTKEVRTTMDKTKQYTGSNNLEFMLRSKNMNWVLRKEIREETDKVRKSKLLWVYMFWWNRVHYLDAYKKESLREINKTARMLRELIREELSESNFNLKAEKIFEDFSNQLSPITK